MVQAGIVRKDTSVNMEVLMNVALPKYVRKAAPGAGGGRWTWPGWSRGVRGLPREGRGVSSRRKGKYPC